MTLATIIEKINVGGVVSIIVVLLSLVEITPIKLSPLKWIGNRVNSELMKRVDEIDKNQKHTEAKLDEHVAQSLRTKIIMFQDDVIQRGMLKTHAQWREILRACDEYEQYVKANDLINGDATEAIDFIHKEYQRVCTNRQFLDLSQI